MTTEQGELPGTDQVDVIEQAPLQGNDDEDNNQVADVGRAEQSPLVGADQDADQAALIVHENVTVNDEVVIVEPVDEAESIAQNGVEVSLADSTTLQSSATNEYDSEMFKEETVLNVDNIDLHVEFADIRRDDESDDTLSITSDMDYLLQKKVSKVSSFFSHMTVLPRVSEMELTPEEEEEAEIERSIVGSVLERDELTGTFVNPLTGEEDSSSKSTSQSDFVEEDVSAESEQKQASTDAVDWISIASVRSIADVTKKSDLDLEEGKNIFELMFDGKTSVDGAIEFSQKEMEEFLQLEFKQSIERFVNNLIDDAVDFVDYIDPKEVLATSLDKVKMLKQMLDDVIEMETERQINKILNVKVVDYYYKKKMFRSIGRETPKMWAKTFPPYVDALNKLDNALKKEHNTIETKNLLSETENRELQELEELVNVNEKSFDEVVYNTIVKFNSSGQWKEFVVSSLEKMTAERNKISKERISVIKLQHLMADLTERLKRTELVTPEFTMTNYERLTATIVKLGDMNDEINQSISRTTDQYHNMLHLLAHVREKRLIIICQMQSDNQAYQNIKANQNNLCERLHRSKIIHSTLGRKFADLSYSAGGLLDKPNLMRDYDETVDAIKELGLLQQRLQKEHSELLSRIDTFRRAVSTFSKKSINLEK